MVATYKSKTAETRTGAMANSGWSTGASGYDDEDRLVSWTRDDNNLSQSWTLTKEGDWSQFVENTTTENRTHGPAHELTAVGSTALSYDPKGNLTVDNTKNHGYTWDFDNRMSAADTDGDNVDEVTLKYDTLGRRVAKTSGSATVVYVSMTQPIQYSPFAGQVVAEYASGAAATSPTEKYVYASYIDEPVLKDGTGGTVYYHRNSQYSVAALTSTTGAVVERYAYEPYGELTILAADGSTVRGSSSYANPYTYTGRRWDADLGLYYFRARYYDPKLGRFVGRDPLYTNGGYSYVHGNPVAFADPSGMECQQQDHHWIPDERRSRHIGARVNAMCRRRFPDFNRDDFTNTLPRCWGCDSECDLHHFLHNRYGWNDIVEQLVQISAGDCCAFLELLGREIQAAWDAMVARVLNLPGPLTPNCADRIAALSVYTPGQPWVTMHEYRSSRLTASLYIEYLARCRHQRRRNPFIDSVRPPYEEVSYVELEWQEQLRKQLQLFQPPHPPSDVHYQSPIGTVLVGVALISTAALLVVATLADDVVPVGGGMANDFVTLPVAGRMMEKGVETVISIAP